MVGNLLHCAPDIVESTAAQDGHITKLSDFLSLLVQMYNNETSGSCSCFLQIPVCTHRSISISPCHAHCSSQILDNIVLVAAAASCS